MTVFVRPSAADRFFACASSALAPEAPHDPSTLPQAGGSATHHAIWLRILSGHDPDLDAIATMFGLEDAETELCIPYALFQRAWRELERFFPNPQPEVKLVSELTGGTADLVSASDTSLSLLDWKAGRVEKSHRYQVAAYAHCLRHQYGMPADGVIRAATVWLRHEHWTVDEFTDADLDAFEHRFREQLERVGSHYAAGEHCGFCPRRLTCATRAAYLRQGVELFRAADLSEPEALAPLYPRYRELTALLEEYKQAVRIAAAEKSLPVGDGRVVRLRRGTRKTIRAREAWPVLAQVLSEEDLASAVTVTKGKVEALVKAKAPRGQKGKAAAALIDALRRENAIAEEDFTSLEMGYARE